MANENRYMLYVKGRGAYLVDLADERKELRYYPEKALRNEKAKIIREVVQLTGYAKDQVEEMYAETVSDLDDQKAKPVEQVPHVGAEAGKLKAEIDEETRRGAMELLKDPAFFFKLGKVFEYGFTVSKINRIRFVISEERNKRCIPIFMGAATKRNLTSVIRLLGAIGTAKDTILRLSLDLLSPGISFVERGYLTPGGLRYSEKIHQAEVLYIPDSPEFSGEMGRQLRLMRSDDGGIIFEYAHQDPNTKMMTTTEDKLPVKMIVTSSNELRMDPALESGAWTLETDDDATLTRMVQEEKFKLRAGKRLTFPDKELEIWKAAFQIALTEEAPQKISIPYADRLIYLMPKESTTQRRSPDRLCDLIESVAFFRRFQKPLEKQGEADLVDLYIALQLGLEAILKTIAPLNPRDRKILDAVKNASNNASTRDVAKETKLANNTAYQLLEKLVDKGYLSKDKEGGRNVYSVIEEDKEDEVGKLLLGLNKSPEAVFNLLKPILSSDDNSSTLIGVGEEILMIDPITAKTIVITANDGEPELNEARCGGVDPHLLKYPFVEYISKISYTPHQELKSSKPSPTNIPTGEKKAKEVLLRENKSSEDNLCRCGKLGVNWMDVKGENGQMITVWLCEECAGKEGVSS